MFGHRAAVLLRFPTARLVRPNAYTSASTKFAPLLILNSARRSFATPGRPKKAVGEPSRPVKRAVKAAGSSGDSAATAKVAANKKTAAKKTGAKKPKKVLTQEEAAQLKERKEAKKAKDDAKNARLKARKEKAKEQLLAKKAKDKAKKVKAQATSGKAHLADLKAAALDPPKVKSANAYTQFSSEKGSSLRTTGKGQSEAKLEFAAHSKNAAAEWKNLSPAEIEHYIHAARETAEASKAEFKRWVESHSANEIYKANVARAALRRTSPARKSKWAAIQDERTVKQPSSAYILFFTDRQASGDMKNIAPSDRAKLVGQEWKALDVSEKQKYEDLHVKDRERYATEHTNVYGVPPPATKGVKSSGVSAAEV